MVLVRCVVCGASLLCRVPSNHTQDEPKLTDEEIAARKKKRTFKKFTYRGVDLDKLLDLSHAELVEMLPSGIRCVMCICVCVCTWIYVCACVWWSWDGRWGGEQR